MLFLQRYLPAFNRNAWLFLLSVIISGVAASIFQLYFNLYVLALGINKETLGLLSSIPSAVILLLGLPIGLLADRMGGKAALATGNALAAVGVLIQVSSATPWVIAVGLLLFGLGQALSLLSTAPFIMQISDSRARTGLFSAQLGLYTLSGFMGSLLAGYLPGWLGALGLGTAASTAYGVTLLTGGGLLVISNLPLWMIQVSAAAPPVVAPTVNPERRGLLKQLTRPIVLKLVAPQLITGFGAAILIPYMNVFFKEKFILSDAGLGLLFSLGAVITGVATLLAPQLEKLLGSKIRAMVVGQTVSLVFILLIGFWPGLWVAGIAYLIRGALMNMVNPLFEAFSMEQVSHAERSTVNGVQTIMWNVGWTFGPAISGFVQQYYGFAPLFIATTVLYSGGIALTYFLFRNTEAQAGAGLPLPQVE